MTVLTGDVVWKQHLNGNRRSWVQFPEEALRSFSTVGSASLLYKIMYAQVGESPGFDSQKEHLFFSQYLAEQKMLYYYQN